MIDTTEIKFDRITKDFAVLDDGRPVAFAPSYAQAEAKRVAYLAERRELEYTATELDGGTGPDAMAADVVSGLVEPTSSERYGICDEPTEGGAPCGCRFPLSSDPGAINYCPACNSSAVLEPANASLPIAERPEPYYLGKGLSPLGKLRVGG